MKSESVLGGCQNLQKRVGMLTYFHRGNFASVFRAIERKSGKVVAIKRINKMRLLWGSLRKKQLDLSSEVRRENPSNDTRSLPAHDRSLHTFTPSSHSRAAFGRCE